MVYKKKFTVGVEAFGAGNFVSNRAMIVYMEETGSFHSATVGLGLNDIETKHRAWVVLEWNIRVIKRPAYNEEIEVGTWSRKMDRLYAYRDFEIKSENGEVIAIGTSKWILVDTESMRPVRLTKELEDAFGTEDRSVMGENADTSDIFDKNLIAPEALNRIDGKIYKTARRDIDINGHVHNINYIDIAQEFLPEEVFAKHEFNRICVLYKKEIKYPEEVMCRYFEYNERHYVAMMSEGRLNAVVLWEK